MVMNVYWNRTIMGALDLKRSYQRNLLMAVLIGVGLHLAPLGTYMILTGVNGEDVLETAEKIVLRFDVIEIPPPGIHVDPIHPAPPIKIPETTLRIGIPDPVDDTEVSNYMPILSRQELAATIGDNPFSGNGDGTGSEMLVIPIDPPEDIIPQKDEFIPVDEYPECINLPMPEYPEMARRAGLEGWVWMSVYVGTTGKALKAEVIESSESRAGFEEAAIEAALKSVWTPGLQNNNPVGCWVTYKVEFKLD